MTPEDSSRTTEETEQAGAQNAQRAQGRRVVVGVDGSPGSLAALQFALTEAQVRGCELQAVCAWEYPVTYGALVTFPAEYNPEADAEQVLSEAITAVTEGTAAGAAAVTPIIAQGSAAPLLLEAAAGAELLVVGSRGRGGFTALLLGSVSSQCVHHAPCPVVVVPPPAESSS